MSKQPVEKLTQGTQGTRYAAWSPPCYCAYLSHTLLSSEVLPSHIRSNLRNRTDRINKGFDLKKRTLNQQSRQMRLRWLRQILGSVLFRPVPLELPPWLPNLCQQLWRHLRELDSKALAITRDTCTQ